MRRPVVIILGLFDTGVGIIRSLSGMDFEILGFDFDKNMPGFKSRYSRAKLCPHPMNQREESLKFFIGLGKEFNKPPVLFATSDIFVLFLSRFRNELKQYFNFLLPSREVIEAIVNKKRQYELAKMAGITVPKTHFLSNPEEINRDIPYPAFLKPVYSYKWQEKFPRIKGFKVKNKRELEKKLIELHSTGIELMVQEIIPGPNTNHYKVNVYINKKNCLLALFMLRKIRQYPVEFGVGSCVESIYDEDLKILGLKFFTKINYQGIGSIEFKRDERDNKLKFIELNPRYWQQNHLATVCGINFPLIQYLDLTGQNPKPQTKFRIGIKWLDLIADFQSFWDYYRKGQLSPWQWFCSLRCTKSIANWSIRDPNPFLKNIQYGFKFIKVPLYLLKASP